MGVVQGIMGREEGARALDFPYGLNQVREFDLGLTGVDCITLRAERRIEEEPAAYKAITLIVDAQVQAGLVQVVA